jgi:hypothetical protein
MEEAELGHKENGLGKSWKEKLIKIINGYASQIVVG